MEKSILLSQKSVHVWIRRTASSPMQRFKSHTHTVKGRQQNPRCGWKTQRRTAKDCRIQPSQWKQNLKDQSSDSCRWNTAKKHFLSLFKRFFTSPSHILTTINGLNWHFHTLKTDLLCCERECACRITHLYCSFSDKLYYLRLPGEMSKHPVRERKRKSVLETLNDLDVEVLTRTCS